MTPTPEEIAVVRKELAAAQAEGDSFSEGAELALQMMLQSPRFIYRVEEERGQGALLLNHYEIASRISYFVLGAPPDHALFEAAAAERLHDPEEVALQIDRLMGDPRATRAAEQFVIDWLNLDRLDNLTRDPDMFPDWDPALARDMKAETVRFFTYLALDQERPIAELFDAQLTFLTPALAAHYGIEGTITEGQPVSLEGDPQRGGLLTQGALATIGGNNASMVGRGLFILEKLLCGHLEDPPPGVDTTPEPASADQSQREVSEERVEDSACGGCHIQIEPVAWSMEQFDAVGRFVTEDAFGNSLREDGSVVFTDEIAEFSTKAELNRLLAEAVDTRSCMSQKVSQFALGRPLVRDDENDRCAKGLVSDAFIQTGGTYRDLLLTVIQSPSFQFVEGQP
ncbi:MAG: DUF1592 domain-containing protein [Myxococcota bacterium]